MPTNYSVGGYSQAEKAVNGHPLKAISKLI